MMLRPKIRILEQQIRELRTIKNYREREAKKAPINKELVLEKLKIREFVLNRNIALREAKICEYGLDAPPTDGAQDKIAGISFLVGAGILVTGGISTLGGNYSNEDGVRIASVVVAGTAMGVLSGIYLLGQRKTKVKFHRDWQHFKEESFERQKGAAFSIAPTITGGFVSGITFSK